MIAQGYFVTFIIGKRGSGKTLYMIGDPALGVPSYAEKLCRDHNMRCIILDTLLNRNVYEDFAVVNWRKIETDWQGAVRSIITAGETEFEEFCEYASKNFRDTLIILEDAGKYLPERFRGSKASALFTDTKNIRCGVVAMVHDYMMIPERAFAFIDELVIFNNQASPASRRTALPAYAKVVEVHNRVIKTAAKKPYYHERLIIGG